jgi:hypothetical protein
MAHALALGSSFLIGAANGYKKIEDTVLYKSATITSFFMAARILGNFEKSTASPGIKLAALFISPPLVTGLTVLHGKYLGHAIKSALE